MKRFHTLSLSIILIAFVAISCQKDPVKGVLKIQMAQKVGGDVLTMNQMKYMSPAGHPYQINKLKYILSEFSLVDKAGNTIRYDGGLLTEVQEGETQVLNLDVPPGDYTQLKFRYGLSKENNIKSYLPNTVKYQNMYWPKPLGDTTVPTAQRDPGFHYMQYEGRYDSLGSGVIKVFNLHTGPTFGADNSFMVTLPFSQTINIDGNEWNLDLIMDLQEWLQNPKVFDYETFGPAIMPIQAAQDILKANGKTVFSLSNLREK